MFTDICNTSATELHICISLINIVNYFFLALERSLLLLLLLDELEDEDDRDELPELLDEDRDDDRDELLSDELQNITFIIIQRYVKLILIYVHSHLICF